MMSYLSVFSFRFTTGIILFAKRNAIPAIKRVTINKGCIKRNSGIPADFIATSSKLSPRLPKVIILESSRASGNARGTLNAATKPVSFARVKKSRPLPTRSSIYNQKNCITKTNNVMRNVARNGPMKALMIRASSFFITLVKFTF